MKDNFNKQSRVHFIKWLSELRKKDIFLVGGKGANLGELYYLGFPVPQIITSFFLLILAW